MTRRSAVATTSAVVPVEEAGTNGEQPKRRLLSREDILAANDVRTREVHAWGGVVLVRSLTGRQRDTLEARFTDDGGNLNRKTYPDFRATYVSLAVVDEDGKLVFSEADIKALGEKSSGELQKVFDAALELSATSPGAVDDLVADLKADPSASSGTD